MNQIKKFFYYSSLATIGLAIALILYSGFLAYYPFPTITSNYKELPVITKVVREGDIFSYKVSYCIHNAFIITYQPRFEGEQIVLLPEVTRNLESGCIDATSSRNKVPDLIPGKYRLVIDVQIKVNSFQTQTQRYTTEEFTVIK